MFETNGNFKDTCIKNNLAFGSLRWLYQNNSIPITFSKRFIEKYKGYTGWYAIVYK
jgi:hypothetical protein